MAVCTTDFSALQVSFYNLDYSIIVYITVMQTRMILMTEQNSLCLLEASCLMIVPLVEGEILDYISITGTSYYDSLRSPCLL